MQGDIDQIQQQLLPHHQQIESIEKKVFETIHHRIQQLNESCSAQTTSKRNLLNKWFIDSIKNYFMEQYAAPLLFKSLDLSTSDSVKKHVLHFINPFLPKYMGILRGYVDLLIRFNKLEEFTKILQDTMVLVLQPPIRCISIKDYNQEKIIRKQFVSLLVVVFCKYYSQVEEISSFFDLWNISFPNDKQLKKRLSKIDVKSLSRASIDETSPTIGSVNHNMTTITDISIGIEPDNVNSTSVNFTKNSDYDISRLSSFSLICENKSPEINHEKFELMFSSRECFDLCSDNCHQENSYIFDQNYQSTLTINNAPLFKRAHSLNSFQLLSNFSNS